MFAKQAYAAVLHHQQNPEFYDEVSAVLSENTLAAVSCEARPLN